MQRVYLTQANFQLAQSLSNVIDGYSFLQILESEADIQIIGNDQEALRQAATLARRRVSEGFLTLVSAFIFDDLFQRLQAAPTFQPLIQIFFPTFSEAGRRKPTKFIPNKSMFAGSNILPAEMNLGSALNFSISYYGAAHGLGQPPPDIIWTLMKPTFVMGVDDPEDTANHDFVISTVAGIPEGDDVRIPLQIPEGQFAGGAHGTMKLSIAANDPRFAGMGGTTRVWSARTEQEMAHFGKGHISKAVVKTTDMVE